MDIKIDLQLFAQEKTEKATPKKRQDARKKGQVAKSQEINSAFILLCIFTVLKFYLPFMLTEIQKFTIKIFNYMNAPHFTQQEAYNMFLDVLFVTAKLTVPIMLVALLVGITSSYLQVGFLLTVDPLKIKIDKLNPIKGLKRIFSKRSIVELVKSIVKIILVGSVTYLTIKSHINIFPKLIDTDIYSTLFFLGDIIYKIAWRVALALIILAVFDLVYQKWEHEQSIKMSKHDVKEEYKQTEGNPQIKGKIKEKQRQMAMSRMMQDVPKADVIITNPTHLAIAIQYEEGMTAPKVIAKGKDKIAENIKKIAIQNQIPTVENKPLAQALYRTVEIGDLVPQELYQAVAEVLAFIYQLSSNKRAK